ncbi:GNAT family N-acetyltransferase [candidate division WOR-3 bacterium JGI_Cruoil_03_44_89]|uniref:GNAT family N-acetyltransferase n=1 Tax=candidate division WOR-3 bacterium JGI_Cruoil_03_44_89 TaxID=1973748 RepID=A0A235BYG1_UNCW3|nr:MAG: GNAT family N-acetyltransferase [candidate division WOR-3 bacterium JGI_Cruoil_03_44_89]
MKKELIVFTPESKPSEEEKNNIVKFLFEHLEKYGDSELDILKAVDYALKEYQSFGGLILTACINSELVGAVVINKTGMKDYIPENILVYIATHKNYRGKGIGKYLMQQAINLTDGDIALHVEPDNPAKYLYEKIGFTNKYLEMRFKKRK